MKKHYLLASAIAALTLVSCSDDDFMGPNNPGKDEAPAPIELFSAAKTMSRATLTGADAANKLGNKFVVFGESFVGSTATTIFDNYLVTYAAGTAGTTDDNSHDWGYAGNESLKGAMQDVKYWNFNAEKYQFVAASGLAASESISNTRDGMRINVTDADAMTSIYVADRVTATPTAQAATASTPASSAYKDVVTLNFRRLGSQMRIGFYETIPGYAVKNLVFYYIGAPSGSATIGTGGAFPTSGKYTVTYDDATNAAHVKFAGTGNVMDYSKTFGQLQYVVAESKFSTADKKYIDKHGVPVAIGDAVFIGSSAAEATFGKGTYTIDGAAGTESEYRPILPNESNSLSIQMRVDYTLVALDGSGEEIQVRDAYVKVPVEYCKWAPNTSYTYLFKISDQTNGYTGIGGGGNVNPGPDDPGYDPDKAGRDPETNGGDSDPEVDGSGEIIPPYIPNPSDPNPTIPNPDYDPTQPEGPDNPSEIPNPDVPLVPNPSYPSGPTGDQHDPSNPVPTPEDPLNPGQPDPSNPVSLYPITFDAVVIDALAFTQETITTVNTPSITTYVNGSDVISSNEYKVGEAIVLTVPAEFTPLAWEVINYGTTAITETQAANLDKNGNLTTWTGLGGNILTPSAEGYWIVRMTYADGQAYKVIKVVE